MKTYSRRSTSIIFTILLSLVGTVSAAESFKIFDGFVAFKSLKSMKIDKALSDITEINPSKLTPGDFNNICVAYAVNKEFSKAFEACSTAQVQAKATRGFPRSGLKDIMSNLSIVSGKVSPLALVSSKD
ncbi:hypothetical protein N9X66_08925 [Gammaproteobacteria bacterium]|nr:hypothetical protein [Gammaproteobacteria bacterium]